MSVLDILRAIFLVTVVAATWAVILAAVLRP